MCKITSRIKGTGDWLCSRWDREMVSPTTKGDGHELCV